MANRSFSTSGGTIDKAVVSLYLVVTFGASGAPTLKAWDPLKRTYSTAGTTGTKGIKSITRVSAGLYTINLQDAYNRFLGGGVSSVGAAAPAAPINTWVTPDTNLNSTTAPRLQLQFFSGSTATDPASGEQVVVNMTFQNSSAL